MASHNSTANSPRFRVMRDDIGKRFVVVDTVAIEIYEFNTKLAADQDCARRNGTLKKSRGRRVYDAKTDRDIDPDTGRQFDADTGREIDPPLKPREQRLVDTCQAWLPPILRTWSGEVAAQCGYGGARRKSWPTYRIMRTLDAPAERFKFSADTLSDVHFTIWETYCEEAEMGRLLAVHYLSPDPDIIKGAHFGLSRRQYQREVDTAYRWLARQFVQRPQLPAIERTVTLPGNTSSDRAAAALAATWLAITRPSQDDYQWIGPRRATRRDQTGVPLVNRSRRARAHEDDVGDDDDTGSFALDRADRANLRLVK
jgi:hypothetical protein